MHPTLARLSKKYVEKPINGTRYESPIKPSAIIQNMLGDVIWKSVPSPSSLGALNPGSSPDLSSFPTIHHCMWPSRSPAVRNLSCEATFHNDGPRLPAIYRHPFLFFRPSYNDVLCDVKVETIGSKHGSATPPQNIQIPFRIRR